jgi:hypothetical protein
MKPFGLLSSVRAMVGKLSGFLLGLAGVSHAHGKLAWHWANPPTTGNDLLAVRWCGTGFVAVGESGSILASETGTGWRQVPSPVDTTLETLAFDGRQWVAIGKSGTLLTSPDGSGWRQCATDLKVNAATDLPCAGGCA